VDWIACRLSSSMGCGGVWEVHLGQGVVESTSTSGEMCGWEKKVFKEDVTSAGTSVIVAMD
jgi:hypothetical protein